MAERGILITGVGGMIGYALAQRLSSAGRKVVGMDRMVPTGGELNCPMVVGELSDPHRLHWALRQHKVDRIVHCGAYSGPMLMRDNPFQLLETNVHGTMHVFEAAKVVGARRLVFLSSIAAYGPMAQDRPVPEATPLLANEPYGASKVCGEAMLRAYATRYNLDGVALRPGAVYGPRRTTDCLIRQMITDALEKRPTRLDVAADWRRQYVYVDDVVTAIILALDAPHLPLRAYNVTGGVNPSLGEVASTVRAALLGARIEFTGGAHPFDSAIGPLDISAARRDLHYDPRITLAAGVGSYAAWLKAALAGNGR